MSLFRQDPFFSSSSFFPRPFSSLTSLFDYPVSAPMYTLYDFPIDTVDRPRTRNSPKDNTQSSTSLTSTTSSPSTKDSRLAKAGSGKDERVEERRQGKSVFSPLPFSSALSPFRSMPSMDMTIDMFSTPTAYTVHAAVPGLNKNDINITVDEHVLTIEAERREEKRFKSPNNNHPSSNNQLSTNQSSTNSSSTNQSSTTQSFTNLSTPSNPSPSTTSSTSASTPPSSTQPKEEKYPDADETKVSTTGQQSSSTAMTDDNDVSYHHMESFYGRVSRKVQLPEDARVDELTAKYEDGIIKIEIPRSQQEPKPRGRKIELQ